MLSARHAEPGARSLDRLIPAAHHLAEQAAGAVVNPRGGTSDSAKPRLTMLHNLQEQRGRYRKAEDFASR